MRYYGGKWRIAPEIVKHFPPHAVYVEPFGGAASVLLQKAPATCEVYNDLCAEVVNVFRVFRDSPEALLRGLHLTPYARDEYKLAYESTSDPVEAARRFIFRSSAGIGTHSSMKHNGFRTSLCDVKHATAVSWAGLPECLLSVVERLRGVIIENRPAIQVMQQFDHGHTLHYVDPPYLNTTRKDSRQGYKHEMSSPEHHRELLQALKKMKGMVIISGYPSPLYEKMLKSWHRHTLSGGRDQTNERTHEVLWANFELEPKLL